jgi:hypothetical protein
MAGRNPVSLTETRGHGEGKKRLIGVSLRLRVSARTSGICSGRPELFSRSHGEPPEQKALHSSVSPRLRENIRSSRRQTTRISREDAMARRNTLNWVPWRLRGFAREILCSFQSKPGSLTATQRHGKAENTLYRLFSASPRLRERIGFSSLRHDCYPLPQRTPCRDLLALVCAWVGISHQRPPASSAGPPPSPIPPPVVWPRPLPAGGPPAPGSRSGR